MLCVILCAYNEELAIQSVLSLLRETAKEISLEVILVDDACRDRTYALASSYLMRMPLRIIRHERNWGLGLSLRQAMEIAVAGLGDDDYIVTMDADATHPPQFISRMIEVLEKSQADVAIASRYAGEGSGERGMPILRRVIAKIARLLFALRFLYIWSVKDSTTGFRCYRAGALRRLLDENGKIMLNQKGFAVQMEILLALRKRGMRVAEAPFLMNYRLKRSASGLRWASACRDYLALLLRGPINRSLKK